MSIESLADALIASRCGTHSLGLVYEFLLKTCCSAKQARADFIRYLSGELPAGLLEEAQFWVAEEQGALSLIEVDGGGTGTECEGDYSPAVQAQNKTEYEYEATQASW